MNCNLVAWAGDSWGFSDRLPDTIVYIDEMGIDTFIYREYAYSKKGTKVIGRIPGRKYKRTGLVAAMMNKSIIAPLQ